MLAKIRRYQAKWEGIYTNLTTIVMWWDGPYTVNEVRKLDPLNKVNGNGLYLLVGRGPREKSDQIKYCGLTEGTFASRLKRHLKLKKVSEECRLRNVSVWLGNLEYPRKFQIRHLRTAEKLIIYFWQPKHNDQGKISLPNPTCLVSRWYYPNGWPRVQRRGFLKDVPDVIWYDGEEWRSGNLRIRKDMDA